MNLETVTIGDCLDMMEFKNKYTVIRAGKVIEFKYEHDRDDQDPQQSISDRRWI